MRHCPSLFCKGSKCTRNTAPHTWCQALGSIVMEGRHCNSSDFYGPQSQLSPWRTEQSSPKRVSPVPGKAQCELILVVAVSAQTASAAEWGISLPKTWGFPEPFLRVRFWAQLLPLRNQQSVSTSSWAGDRKVTWSAESQLKGSALAQPLIYPGPAEALGSTAQCSNILFI